MKLLRRVVVYSLTAVLAAGAVAVLTPGSASAHGAMMKPGSRLYFCWLDGLNPQGNITPKNPACAAAAAQSGVNPLYNWFGVLRSDGAGRTRGFIPDGQLCSGGNPSYAGWNVARDDWPVTHVTAGANFDWWYSNWAAHPGTFTTFVTRDTWSPTRPLAWNDLETTPFLSVTNPPQQGSVGTNDGHYYWSGRFPSGKSGRHIIYSVWTRSDSQETFYGCSDVVFDGGNGNVTGIGVGGGGGGGTSPSPSSPGNPSPSASASVSPSPVLPSPSVPQQPGGCTASYTVASQWPDGFQGDVRVTNTASSALNGWTVRWTFANGQTIDQLWSGALSASGASVTVKNMTWNGALAPNSSTTFGFTGRWSGGNSVPTVSCQSP